tara:strand:- start:326 stop:1156 length:831 start_codon:yes stop_codon:yes gene_type:complete
MNKSLPNYDFLGSIYICTKRGELKETLDSLFSQTHKPKNVIIVIDGRIKYEVKNLLKEYENILPIKKVSIKYNVGLGLALRRGLKECKSKIVLRFDTDDIYFKDRAKLLVKELHYSDLDIIGSNVYEFIDNPNEFVSQKIMPKTHKEIRRQILFRNPINHNSVGFLKDSILKLDGGYRHFPYYEDYDLWIRAMFNGLRFKNLNKSLVAMRVSSQRKRRRGLNIFFMESKLLKTFFEGSILYGVFFLPILFFRSFFALLPLRVFSFVINRFFRKKNF